MRLCSSVTPRQIIGFPVHEWSLSVAGRAAWYRGNLIYVFPGLFTRRPRKGVRGVLTSGRSTAFAGNGGWLRGAEEEAEFVSLEFGCYRFLMGKIVRFRVHIVHIDHVPPSILTPIKSSFPISLFAFYASSRLSIENILVSWKKIHRFTVFQLNFFSYFFPRDIFAFVTRHIVFDRKNRACARDERALNYFIIVIIY